MQSTNPRLDAAATVAAGRQLEELVGANPQISLAVLTTGDGFEVAAHGREASQTQRVAAMSSSLQALSEAIVREAGLSDSRNLIIESTTGVIVVMGIANVEPRLSLAVVASGENILGHLLWTARNCCMTLARELKQA